MRFNSEQVRILNEISDAVSRLRADVEPPKPTRGEEIATASIWSSWGVLRFKYPNTGGESHFSIATDRDCTDQVRTCIADLIDKAIAEEREACAKVADGLEAGQGIDRNQSPYRAYLVDVAAMIRQRGVA